MADEKKPGDASPPKTNDPFTEIIALIFVGIVAMYLINSFVTSISSSRLFSNGLAGFTPRGILLSNTRPIASLDNPLGARAVSVNLTDIFDSPQGRKIGKQDVWSKGIILQGPVSIAGSRFWYVDYEEGEDGWVKETDIAHLEREPSFLQKVVLYIFNIVWILRIIALFVFVLSVAAIVYLWKKVNKYRQIEDSLLYPTKAETFRESDNIEWQKILDRIESSNESDWRLCILQADIILSDLLEKMGLPGETMGDKLKAVEKSDFRTIEKAWEAHKIRNQVAHEGEAFKINHREARRVINLYKAVFKEFDII